ncbi:malonate decarboxylase holo-ACP synthase [Streptomyces bauhiniae]|uniref:Malonate decarboxylase holo-ACP synthase n=1 Tax=Streptomyces bauhiniae TaxID=2340725 RepID=A0A7K3QUG1_9ACTN|nr:malonate decarboxylase holo-ACP synthase [Streptomyces bauhiniae]NEB93516.1 malonate decarboxylase holo-ACP synthase [Streptomyces bauhiniae]
MSHTFRPHDLLRVTDPSVLLTGAPPAWVRAVVERTAWAVVRRDGGETGRVAVGVRGVTRGERHATTVPVAAVAEHVRPEDLRDRIDGGRQRTPAMAALRPAASFLAGIGCPWGPTGSVGFELGTRRPVTTPDSDLDIVIRSDALPSPTCAAEWIGALSGLPARVDCLLETSAGAVALAELAAAPPTLVLRTARGPRLISLAEMTR